MTVTARRLYVPIVLSLLAVGGLAFVALGRPWDRARVAADGLPSDVVTVTGADAYPAASALAVVVVTAAIAVLATGGRVRRAVGVLVVLASAGAIIALTDGRSALESARSDAVDASPAFTGGGSVDVTSTAWDVVTLVAFALAALLGIAVAALAGRWPTMGGRYEAPSASSAPTTPKTEADIWKALDEGRDPTQ